MFSLLAWALWEENILRPLEPALPLLKERGNCLFKKKNKKKTLVPSPRRLSLHIHCSLILSLEMHELRFVGLHWAFQRRNPPKSIAETLSQEPHPRQGAFPKLEVILASERGLLEGRS